MKSLANGLLHVAGGLCKDVSLAYPEYRCIVRDFDRLTRISDSRGLGLFVFDLPNLDSILLMGLEAGRLPLNGPLSTAVSKRIRVPRLFSGLWLRVFYPDGSLKPDADPTSIAFLRQLCCLGKKISGMCSDPRREVAIEEYISVDNQLRSPSLLWDEDVVGTRNDIRSVHFCDSVDSDLPLFPSGNDRTIRSERVLLDKVQQVADLIVGSFNDYDPYLQSGGTGSDRRGIGLRHGPGAVSDRTGVVDKYHFINWTEKLGRVYPYLDFGTYATNEDKYRPSNHEVSSKLIAVPKTAKVPRLIASEPTEHQWCQQLMREFLVEQLSGLFGTHFIDFSDQSKSGKMALQGSKDGSLATIDLSSASDRLSCWTVERIFRSNPSILEALHASRTRYIRIENKRTGTRFLKLKKFASQGTAVTFPVQSIVFLCVALAANISGEVTWSKIRKLRHKVRVFGDDIVIPSTGYAATVSIINSLELRVNESKSYVNGCFRESCGTDSYKGYDVTPVKPQLMAADSPSGRQSLLDTSNNLFSKGYWHASKATEELLPAHVIKRVPVLGVTAARTSCRVSFSGDMVDHLKSRYNLHLHRWEYKRWTIRSRTVIRPHSRATSEMLQYFTERSGHPCGVPPRLGDLGLLTSSKVSDGLRWEPLYV